MRRRSSATKRPCVGYSRAIREARRKEGDRAAGMRCTHPCFSRYLCLDPARSDGFVRAAKALLDAGANANTGWYEADHQPQPEFESVLYGAAGIAHHAELTRLLLERGADANDDEVRLSLAGDPRKRRNESPRRERQAHRRQSGDGAPARGRLRERRPVSLRLRGRGHAAPITGRTRLIQPDELDAGRAAARPRRAGMPSQRRTLGHAPCLGDATRLRPRRRDPAKDRRAGLKVATPVPSKV